MTTLQFSKRIKEGTSKSHSAAENTKFVASFLRGVLDPEEYRKLLTNFWYVYDTMEQRIQESNDPIVQVLKQWNPILFRTSFLQRDLQYYYGPMWREKQIPSEACNKYCYRITEVGNDDPYLLVSHHYTRYIGDLSGGKILRGIAEKALTLPEGEGLHFYDFPRIDDAKEFKTNYRSTLDNIGFTESQQVALIDEANHAFRLNMDLFNEIQGSASTSFLILIRNFLFPFMNK